MRDGDKSREQLIREVTGLRHRLRALEKLLTEREADAEAVRASEEKYRGIFDNAPIGIFRTTADGRLLDANFKLARMLGYPSPLELILTTNRTSVAEALYADPEERQKLVVSKLLPGKEAWNEAEIRLRRTDGETIVVKLFYRGTPRESNESAILEGFAEDVSERRRAEHALRLSEIKYRIVADNTYDWEYWVNPEGRYLYSSRSCERITGWRASEFENDSELLSRIIHPEDRGQYEAHLEGVQGSGSRECEFRIIHRDGTTRWIGHASQPVFDAEGGYLGRRGSNRDVTDRKRGEEALQEAHDELERRVAERTVELARANEALRESEARFRTLFDHSPIGISIARQGATLLLNEAGLRMFGYNDYSEVVGTSQLNRIAPHCREEMSGYIRRRERGEAVPGSYETEGIRGDGSIFHLYVQAVGIQLADGPSTVAFYSDITRRKVAEEELARHRGHLEDLVKERTTELSRANEQLTRLIEAHRRTSEDLKEREEFLTAIVENIPDMIFVKDAKDLRFVRFNRAGEDLLGYARNDLIGKSDYDFFPTHEADFFVAKDRDVLHSRHLVDIQEETIQTGRRGQRILHTKKIPILGQDGNPQYLLGISQDITERRQAEKALQDSERRYRQLLGSVTDYLFTIEIKNGSPVSTTHGRGCMAVTGFTPEEYARMPYLWYEMVHPEDQHLVGQFAKSALRGEAEDPLEHRIIHKNGTTRWVRNTMVPRYDTAGRLVACDGLISDITDRKIIEQELKQTNTYLENVFENSPDAIGIVDGSGRFIRWNRMAAELYGYTFEEMKGRSGFDLYADRDELLRMLVHLRREGSIKKWGMNMKRKDGSIVPFEISIGLLKGGQDKTLGSVAVARDLSGIKEALAAVRASNEQLNQEIAERRRAEAALLKSKETLRRSQRNLRSLASRLFTIQETERNRISKELHDGLGQDLTVLKIYLASIQSKLREDQRSLTDDCEFLFGRIDHSLENMRRLCHDLSPYLLEELGLAASLRHLFDEVCRQNRLCCLVDLEEISPYLSRRTLAAVYRIFQEALTNIVKHAEATEVSLSIKRQNHKVDFLVADNGRGFDIRAVNQRPPSERGMGLFAMEERIRMLGGTFQIMSGVGQGTTISFSLTLKKKEKP